MDFQRLYAMMFNAATDAVREIEHQNYGTAAELLKKAQQDAEEEYLAQTDKK